MITDFNKENIKWIRDEKSLPACYYKIKVPSVSQILSILPDPEWDEFIAKVGKDKADQIMTAAGNKGSAMHMFIENFITKYNQTKDISEALKYTQEESPKILTTDNIPKDKIEDGRNLFYKFYYSDYPNRYSDMLAIEFGIYSPTLFYRGKLDILYRDKLFGPAITDFKSINGKLKQGSIKEIKFFYQLGGYANAVDEMYKEKGLIINKASILCIDKQSDMLHEIELSGEKLQEYKEKFKTLVHEYHRKNNQEYLIQI